MDIQKTLLDIRRGFYASLFVLIATALMSILIFFSPSSLDTETIKAFQDNWIDAILIAFLTFGIYRKSRLASTFMVLYWLLTSVYKIIILGPGTSGFISLLVLYFLVMAAIGTFKFHKYEKNTNPDYKNKSIVIKIIFGFVSILIFGLMIFGLLIETQSFVFNTGEFEDGLSLNYEDRKNLSNEGVIRQTDEIKYFYFFGLRSPFDIGGQILTNDRYILYYVDDNGVDIYEQFYTGMIEIESQFKGNSLSDSEYIIKDINGYEFPIYIPVTNEIEIVAYIDSEIN